MIQKVNISLLIVFAIVAGVTIVAQQPATQVPATVVLKVEMRLNGQLVDESIRNIAWKSDGSTAHQTISLSHPSTPTSEVIDFSRRVMTIFDPLSQTMAEVPTTPPQTKWLKSVFSSCQERFSIFDGLVTCEPSQEVVLGYHVDRVVLERNREDGKQSRLEMLVAPRLNYFPLVKKDFLDGDLRSHSYALEVREGPPDEHRFSLPAYKKLSRADFLVAAEKQRGHDVGATRWVETIRRIDSGLPPCRGRCGDPVE